MDETQPLLSSNGSENYITQQQQQDQQLSSNEVNKTIIVEFDPNGDPANPITWPPAYKRGVVTLLAFMAFTVYVYKPTQTKQAQSQPLLTPDYHLIPLIHPRK